ncbi:type II secretion system protein GspJ [Pseudidiomarina sp. CB1]|uniref:type II secretion system protein GspJ n=1 Tax=Pseudidiomarina sp. CB1 TaxID=2972484 RepID=UPI002162F45A|nr:type II secretion system protein GspJ [Pseudidiomarina sp. CB1]
MTPRIDHPVPRGSTTGHPRIEPPLPQRQAHPVVARSSTAGHPRIEPPLPQRQAHPVVARSSTAGHPRIEPPLPQGQAYPVVEPRATTVQQRKHVGFTLVEVLVAIVVFAIIGLASAAVVNSMMRTNEQSAEVREELQQLQQAMLMIENDLRQAVSRRTPEGDYYVRAGWFNPGNLLARSELQPVRYIINQDQQLVRQHYTYADMSPTSDPTERVVLEGVTEFQVEPIIKGSERSGLGITLNQQPQAEQDGPMEIPDGVEVTLKTERWGTIVRVFILNGGDFSEPQSSNQPSP